MRPRIAQELDLLRRVYGDLEHIEEAGEDWICLPGYPMPEGWQICGLAVRSAPVALLVKADYPGAAPYGFLMPAGIAFEGTSPGSTGDPPKQVPFPGDWLHFSWSAENWSAGSDACEGSNLVTWCGSFSIRLKEGT